MSSPAILLSIPANEDTSRGKTHQIHDENTIAILKTKNSFIPVFRGK